MKYAVTSFLKVGASPLSGPATAKNLNKDYHENKRFSHFSFETNTMECLQFFCIFVSNFNSLLNDSRHKFWLLKLYIICKKFTSLTVEKNRGFYLCFSGKHMMECPNIQNYNFSYMKEIGLFIKIILGSWCICSIRSSHHYKL